MITKDNFRLALKQLGFEKHKDLYIKKFAEFDCELKVDFAKETFRRTKRGDTQKMAKSVNPKGGRWK
jgi:hypothetical protein